jgi:hypothetical protein
MTFLARKRNWRVKPNISWSWGLLDTYRSVFSFCFLSMAMLNCFNLQFYVISLLFLFLFFLFILFMIWLWFVCFYFGSDWLGTRG